MASRVAHPCVKPASVILHFHKPGHPVTLLSRNRPGLDGNTGASTGGGMVPPPVSRGGGA